MADALFTVIFQNNACHCLPMVLLFAYGVMFALFECTHLEESIMVTYSRHWMNAKVKTVAIYCHSPIGS